ncbi:MULTISPECIES: Gfo/Idh/MocA family protein [Kocuria]|uniref:Gfo/Idh/MocA family protein n=1 Tax=Kocuria TaxID=57493 RepID=UPI0006612F73|nr:MULTISPECIES: Gfo/Idh/MocA family oxidoreductase [Kocuria]RUQ20697.1 gfo/Idh/MocA family oxidoreductase [Kocuria sp. HSID16901]
MAEQTLSVAVIGAGMAGRSHAYGYRQAGSVFDSEFPSVRLAAVADMNQELGRDTARRYGFEKVYGDWTEVAEDPEIDAVSIVVGNALHLPIARGLLEAGKHVLCEKPLAGTLEDAQAMVQLEKEYGQKTDRYGRPLITSVGYTVRRMPAINAIKEKITSGEFGPVTNFLSTYLCDYSCDENAPMSWRYKGGPGSGALGDLGSHVIDTGEYLNGPVTAVRGAVMDTIYKERHLPLGAVVGHGHVEVSDEVEPVENEDFLTFTCTFANGAVGTYTISRVAFGTPNSQTYHVVGPRAQASFDITKPAEFMYDDAQASAETRGQRRVLINSETPLYANSCAMDAPGVGWNYNDNFAIQARAFLEQVAGIESSLAPCGSFAEGLHTLEIIQAIAESANQGGREVSVG